LNVVPECNSQSLCKSACPCPWCNSVANLGHAYQHRWNKKCTQYLCRKTSRQDTALEASTQKVE